MNKALATLALLASFAAHAEPLTCADAKACERMWSDAQEAVGAVSNMRIRLLTDSRIETFAPSTYGRTGATVTKVPAGDGYEIRLQIECYRSSNNSASCDKIRSLMDDLFTLMLTRR